MAGHETTFFLNLEMMIPCRPECCWLFTRSPAKLSTLPWRRFFLVPLWEATPDTTDWERQQFSKRIAEGRATSLAHALGYNRGSDRGKSRGGDCPDPYRVGMVDLRAPIRHACPVS